MASPTNGRLDLDNPRWKQDSFSGRVKHFCTVTDPRNILATSVQLDTAKRLVNQYRFGHEPIGTTEEQVWMAKKLYDSAFHPDTGEKQMLIGRMSAQVPMNLAIVSGMMTFYKTTPAVVFWQWVNQSFNALVNYTNRSDGSPVPTRTLLQAYTTATGVALGVGLGLNAMTNSLPNIVRRYVPFAAVVSANFVNIPLMRQSELKHGIPVTDENGDLLGVSILAARQAISMTVLSRIIMVIPGMCIPPIFMNYLEATTCLKRRPWLALPVQFGILAVIITLSVPICCAIFPQRSSMSVSTLEAELRNEISLKHKDLTQVYFNKGL